MFLIELPFWWGIMFSLYTGGITHKDPGFFLIISCIMIIAFKNFVEGELRSSRNIK